MTNPIQKTNGIAKPTSHPSDGEHAHANADADASQYEEDDSQMDGEEGGYASYPRRRKSSVANDMVFVLMVMGLFAAMMGTPSCIWLVRHWNDPTAPVAQGTVQSILYVGNLGIDTQIDTEQRSFIVHGITKLRKGVHVETRKGTWAYALCDQNSDLCEDLVHED